MKKDELYSLIDSYRGSRYLSLSNTTNIDYILSKIPNKETASVMIEKGIINIFNEIPTSSKTVLNFISKLIQTKSINSVLDVWANTGQFLDLIDISKDNKKGYVINDNVFKFNEIINSNFTQLSGDPQVLIEKETNLYHIIISNLPVGLSSQHRKFDLSRTDLGFQLILQSLKNLNKKGTLIATVGDSIFYSSNGTKFIKKLNDLGFKIKGIFETAEGSLNNHSRVSFYLIVIERGNQEKVFIGEVLDNELHQIDTLKNYNNTTSDKNLSKGVLCDIEHLNSLSKLKLIKEVDILVKRTGIKPLKFDDLGVFLNVDDLSSESVTICLPTFLNAKAKIFNSEDNLRKNGYYFLKLNIDKAHPTYLINFLNSEFGKKILSKYANGSVIQNINKSTLDKIELPIPSIDTQKEIVNLDKNLKDLEKYFNSLNQKLWQNPKFKEEVIKGLDTKIRKTNSIEWLEELPFPLASIFWGYHSEVKPNKKVEYLFLFFEGLCEFLDTILMSGLNSDKLFYENEVKKWLKNDEHKLWHQKASFGNWQYLYGTLSKKVRTLFNKKESKTLIVKLFGNANDSFINMLSSATLTTVFSEVVNLRNSFKGHGGITSDNKYKELLSLLEAKFDTIKPLIIDGFSQIDLFTTIPKTMGWDENENLFETTCKLLKGTRSKFNQIEVKTSKVLASEKMYLLPHNQFQPIELLPFVQMREAPKTQQNACYFYNRIEGNQVRLVSYHYDKEEEVFIDLENISSFLNMLNPTD